MGEDYIRGTFPLTYDYHHIAYFKPFWEDFSQKGGGIHTQKGYCREMEI